MFEFESYFEGGSSEIGDFPCLEFGDTFDLATAYRKGYGSDGMREGYRVGGEVDGH